MEGKFDIKKPLYDLNYEHIISGQLTIDNKKVCDFQRKEDNSFEIVYNKRSVYDDDVIRQIGEQLPYCTEATIRGIILYVGTIKAIKERTKAYEKAL